MTKILIVEDDAGVRAITGAILADMGYEVFEAEDAASGLAAALEKKPDVILSDFLMPGMLDAPGRNLFDELSSRPETKDIPLVIASGLPAETVRGNVPKSLWPYIMSKPFDYLRLQSVIEAALKRK